MSAPSIKQAIQFIQAAGVLGLVSGVQTGMVPSAQAITAFRAVGTAIDTYVEAVPYDTSPADLQAVIGGLLVRGDVSPKAQGQIIDLLAKRSQEIDLAVRLAARISTVDPTAVVGVAAVANIEAPFEVGAEFRWIPPGEFQMGSGEDDPYADSDEKPLRMVMTGGFYMLDHPVTNAEFKTFLDATGREDVCDLPRQFAGDDQPAVYVNHEEATAYSKWLGEEVSKRTGRSVIGKLPTEAKWEKAAKGPRGDEFINPATHGQAHFNEKKTRKVSHSDTYANGYGLKDMIGNVWEWTSSQWKEGSSNVVIRGASWNGNNPHVRRAACRGNYDPGVCYGTIGFRPLLALQGSK